MDFADPWSACGLPMSRPGPPRHQQCLSDQDRVSTRHFIFNQYDGTSSFRPVRHDTQQRGKQHIPGTPHHKAEHRRVYLMSFVFNCKHFYGVILPYVRSCLRRIRTSHLLTFVQTEGFSLNLV
jgi:hypothetical protein